MKPPTSRSAYARLCFVADLVRNLLRNFFNYPLVYNKSTFSWELNGTPPNPVL